MPNPSNPQSLNRYSYVHNSPVNFNDPSGHDEYSTCGGNSACMSYVQERPYLIDTFDAQMGLSFKGDWKNTDKTDARKAAADIAKGFAEVLGGPLGWAMTQVYKNGLVFEKSDKSCADAHPCTGWTCWGETVGNTITIYSDANSRSFVYNNFLVHEMGHAFDNAAGGLLTFGYGQRVDYISSGWTDMPTGNAGYACSVSVGQLCPWIQGYHTEGSGYDVDQTADMFLGWVYGQWGDDISGTRRQNWMALWMPFLLVGSAPSPNLQINCNEDTGEGCFPFGE